MRPDDLIHLERYFEYLEKSALVVVELGSGASTVFLLKVLARLEKHLAFFSFEGDKNWADDTLRLIKQYSCDLSPGSLRYIPYVDCGNYKWFDAYKIKDALGDRKIDILIVNSPPGVFPYSREPALTYLWQHLAADSTIILHDTKRLEEKDIAKRWSNFFYKTRVYNSIDGMTIFSHPKLELTPPEPSTITPWAEERVDRD